METKRTIKKYFENVNAPEPIMKFLALFNQIDKYFDRILGTESFLPYNEKIKRIVNGDYSISRFVKLHEFKLKYFGEIRNQITHGIKFDGHTYIQPTEYAISLLEKYANTIKKPPRCGDVLAKHVFTCKFDDKLKKIINIMESNNYSHVPVYDDKNQFVGLLSESNILSRLSKNNVDLEKVKVGDVDLINDNKYVSFINENVNVYEIDKLFADKKGKNEKIGILLITKNGSRDEELLGIISAGDTAKIDSFVLH